MEEYISSSEDSSSSISSTDDAEVENQNSNSKCLRTNPGMEQSTTEQPIVYHCPFCCFQGVAANLMQEHLVHHFTKSAHQCQLCTFSIGSIHELYLHIQQHHLIEDQSSFKVNNRPPGGKRIRVRSDIFKCGQCEFVTKYKQELQRHEIRHKEKSLLQCGLCSYSVSASFYLALHLKNHHSAHQNTPAPIQEIRSSEPASPLVLAKGIKLNQVRRKEPTTAPLQERLFQEVRSGPPIPPVNQVQLQSSRLTKWKVEAYQAGDRSRLAPRTSEDERRSVKGPNPARLRLAQRLTTVSKASQRRKRHGLMLNQAKNSMKKKMNDCLKKKSKPQEAEAAVPVDAEPNSLKINQMKEKLRRKKPKAQKVDVAALAGRLEDVKVEPVESTRDNNKRPKTVDGRCVFKCSDCEFSTFWKAAMKLHQEKHNQKEEFKCDYCSFSARFKRHVTAHSHRSHRDQPAAQEFKCSECDYSTVEWYMMKRHRLRHEREEKYKCDRCSYSARFKSRVTIHSNKYHRYPPSVRLEVKESHGNSIQNIQLLTRIENMKSKVSTAEQEKKQILAQKKDVELKIKEIEEKKVEAELDIRKLMEKQQNSSDSLDFNRQVQDIQIQEKKKRLKVKERKLKSLKQEERSLDEEEKNAEESLIGANQVLQALESELIKLEV